MANQMQPKSPPKQDRKAAVFPPPPREAESVERIANWSRDRRRPVLSPSPIMLEQEASRCNCSDSQRTQGGDALHSAQWNCGTRCHRVPLARRDRLDNCGREVCSTDGRLDRLEPARAEVGLLWVGSNPAAAFAPWEQLGGQVRMWHRIPGLIQHSSPAILVSHEASLKWPFR